MLMVVIGVILVMPKPSNPIGHQYGTWFVLEESYKKNGRRHFKCRCNCGDVKVISSATLYKKPKHCHTCQNLHRKFEDITNQIFGDWTVLYRDEKTKKWFCRCKCGTTKLIAIANLKNKSTKRCKECVFYDGKVRPKIGDVFGDWTLESFEYDNHGLKIYVCRCICGRITKRKFCDLNYESTLSGCQYCRKESGFEDIANTCILSLSKGAKHRGIEFTLTLQDIWKIFLQQNKKCALTGLEIKFIRQQIRNKDYKKQSTASVDRTNSNESYNPNNIQIVHKLINRLKSDVSQEEFIQICNLVAKKHPRNVDPNNFIFSNQQL